MPLWRTVHAPRQAGKACWAHDLGLPFLMHILQCLPHPIDPSELGALGSISMSVMSMVVDSAEQLTDGQVDIGLQLHAPTCNFDLDRKAAGQSRSPAAWQSSRTHLRHQAASVIVGEQLGGLEVDVAALAKRGIRHRHIAKLSEEFLKTKHVIELE